jgi:predicted amidohydrolase YtcJ
MAKLSLLLGAFLCTACGSGPGGGTSADLVLMNGNVITLDDANGIAQAVAVRDGKIQAVGSDEEIKSLIGPETRRVDLDGRTATPGLMDAHTHFSGGGVSRPYFLYLTYPGVQSVRDVVARVKEQAEALEAGEWIQGRGWDEGKFEELRYVYAADLDSVTPDNPVWLTHTMGHYGAANSLAFRLADITVDTPDPPAGTIDRASDGTPTGVLKEDAQGLVRRLIPPATEEQAREGIRQLAKAFNAECMTGVKDPGISEADWDAYQTVLEEGNRTVRVFALWGGGGPPERMAELIERIGATTKPYVTTGDDPLISGGVKLFMDGSGGARTAWLYDEWNRDSEYVDEGNYGYPMMDPDEFRTKVRMLHDAGLHVSIHAIGDRAIDWAVDSYWEALEANPIQGLRHGIIHANIPTDRAIDRMADMQRVYEAGYPEPQANFTWWIGDTYAGNFGPERALRLNPFRTFQEKGILWAGGSDYAVTPFEARYGIWSSVARESLMGVYGSHPYGTDESVDVQTALRSFTLGAAHQMFLEDKVGSIEVGKYADIAVWDRDLYSVETADLKDMKCEMTVFNGEIVFGDIG